MRTLFMWCLSQKIYNLSKMCNLDNSYKNPYENRQIFLIRQVKSMQKFLHILKAFHIFSFVCFHWKKTWYLGKVNKKVKTERVRNWIEAHFSCLDSRVSTSSLAYSLKQLINYCCRICTILCDIQNVSVHRNAL